MSPELAKNWLTAHALPLWLSRGLEAEGFAENLSTEGEPMPGPRRAMVQARQIYVCRTALEAGLADSFRTKAALESGLHFLLRRFSLSSGAFRHSVGLAGEPMEESPDLYGQAFVLFGLANSYAVLGDSALKARAMELVRYLNRERKFPEGGYTELVKGQALHRSNPHMHLFEAAIAWMELDADPEWHRLASDILNLCLARMIDSDTGALGEIFTSGWKRELENGRFVYEPGHLYEWSWLMGKFQALSGRDLLPVRMRLFELAERTGISPASRAAIDQVWSDGTPKLRSARFWPQCERIKAASQLGKKAEATEGMEALFRYFEMPVKGLWYDTQDEAGRFLPQPVKASSLYHIAGAIMEYQALA